MSSVVAINGRDIVAMLLAEARRKPDIAALVETAHTMTDSEIDSVKVPLPWYRKALKLMRQRGVNAETNARLTALINSTAKEEFRNDVEGTTRQWNGDTGFIDVDRGGSVEVKYGQLLWFPKAGGIWIDTLFSSHIDPKLANSHFVSHHRRSEYIAACAEKRNGVRGDVPYTVVAGTEAPSSQDRGLFRIERL